MPTNPVGSANDNARSLREELVRFFLDQGFTVHGARNLDGYDAPSAVRNDGYGSARPHVPDVVAFDGSRKRIVFGLVKQDRESLGCEASLEEYNVFLDHNHALGDQASALYVLLPEPLLQDFISTITHYIHRDYWPRIIPVASRE